MALVALLFVGVAGSLWMSVRAQNTSERAAVEQAETIASKSLSLVFTPTDLSAPVSDSRAAQLNNSVSQTVLDPSPFTTVTLWSDDGVILYSTEVGRIGNLLAGERERIRTAIHEASQTQSSNGEFSVMTGFSLPSGVGGDAAIEFVRPDAELASAAGPWRLNALVLTIALLATLGAMYGVSRLQSAVGTATSFPAPGTPGGRFAPAAPAVRQPYPAEPARKIEALTPGFREEAEARKIAEARAQAAEERLILLQEQYKKALDDLQTYQRMAHETITRPDPKLEERALRAEGLVRTLEGQVRALEEEREKLAGRADELASIVDRAPTPDPAQARKLRESEQEAIGLRAELDGAQTQLSITQRELRALQAQAGRSGRIQEDLDSVHVELGHAREASAAAQAETRSLQTELEDARNELRALRGEEQRAAMLDDELRAVRTELQSATASHRADLVEREADFEDKIRSAREQFQRELSDIESSYREQLSLKESEFAQRISRIESESSTVGEELAAAHAELKAAREEAASRGEATSVASDEAARLEKELETLRAQLVTQTEHHAGYLAELDGARVELASLNQQATAAAEGLASTQAELVIAQSSSAKAGERAERLERENQGLVERLEKLAMQLEDAAGDNAEQNRRLQELEARRALELADDQGRAQIDDLLRVTQERLAGQTEKLMAAEDRIHDLERDVTDRAERTEVVEAQLRQLQMHEALREIREPHGDEAAAEGEGIPVESIANGNGSAPDPRVNASPFMAELSMDAKKSLSRIQGITQILKHKKDGKDQAQLFKQLSSYVRRLDHTVADLADTDLLTGGAVELKVKRTNLEALIERVVEESGVGTDHDVRVEATSFSISIDPTRTEQIIANLLRNAGERTPNGKGITVRLAPSDGGALISVEDPEPASETALSPVVKRFAEVQGGWAAVENRESGGTAFRVFLPDVAPASTPSGEEVQIVVEDQPAQEEWEPSAGQILVQELHRLATED